MSSFSYQNQKKPKGFFFRICIFPFLYLTLASCNFKNKDLNQNELLINLSLINIVSNHLSATELQAVVREKIGILPNQIPGSEVDTLEKISLGKKLFRDNKLSSNHVQSCHTCHPLDGNSAGMDRQSTSRGTFGQIGKRNTPTILNVGFLPIIFWDGRRDTLYNQAIDPFVNPLEMSLPSDTELLNRIQNDSSYNSFFANAFPESPNPNIDSIRLALVAFERSLVSKSRFDDFVESNVQALKKDEMDGLKLFLEVGCNNCHTNNLLGGSQFSKLDSKYSYNPNDFGRSEFTGNPADNFFFKVPPLRNVALTPPYFHDGSVSSLKEAVKRMNQYNLNRNINDSEIELIVSFLKSLSDKTKSN
ncbi:cytochrome-c peroxidase [Leptospira harrisiae]|uniref:Cytochrome-c peroxidase n=1 Tax=Leptospira harrisiae TaxID=2023189 RepID=A0A2N0AFW4_9LEPT|nr:cytochrome c peroxidase [Leptospira harrisiae]PJZ83180.1 cytochrome-c peroxidase [Leptospira harrisiae]PKA07526.1 cytochrome-c peroxidase [Leptospira harrisiae]